MDRSAFPFSKSAKSFVLVGAVAAAFLPGRVLRADDYAQLIARGDTLDAHCQTQQALAAYLEAEKQHQPDAELLVRISKQYAEAMADTDSVPEKVKLGNMAIEYSKKAVALDPNNAHAQLSLAAWYGRIAPLVDNKTKIAYSKLVKEHADKALALDPSNSLTYHVLGAWNYEIANLNPVLKTLARWIYGELPAASNEEAVRYLTKSIELNPNCAGSHFQLGRTYAAMGKKSEAKAELQKSLALPNREKDDPWVKQQTQAELQKL
jgi:tetratricopeptide (TPR) repeat protein